MGSAVGGIRVCYGTRLQSPVSWVRSYHQDCIIFGFSFYIQNLAKILVELEIWIFKSDPSLITCSGGREPGLAVFLFTYSSSEIPLGSRVILYTVGKVFVRRLQRRRNRRKRFSSGGEIPGTSLTIWILVGELILEVCLCLPVVSMPTNAYLSFCHILCRQASP